jgi:hypothetical protein
MMPCQMQVISDCDPMSCLFSICVVAEVVVLTFHLTSHANELANICVAWRRKVQCILCAWQLWITGDLQMKSCFGPHMNRHSHLL